MVYKHRLGSSLSSLKMLFAMISRSGGPWRREKRSFSTSPVDLNVKRTLTNPEPSTPRDSVNNVPDFVEMYLIL